MANKELISRFVADKAEDIKSLAMDIWSYAELSYNEVKSSARMIGLMKENGFTIEEGIAGIPTAFTATFSNGNGKPVMGLLAEYDALDGLSQKAACPVKEPIAGCNTGHGCGHNLLGAGAAAAAIAVKNYLLECNMDGTVILFGCPAEEGAGSKQFIARAGYFDNVDFAYTWHPGYINEVQSNSSVAIMGANFTFDGVASHAGSAPELGRSALDAAELMNVGCNYLREHMEDQARIHYAYSDAGGTAPNVVPSHAVIKYEVRAPKVSQMQELFTRVINVAKGAALMTDTKMEYEVTMAFSDYVCNKTLGRIMNEALKEFGAPEWSEEDYDLAKKLSASYNHITYSNMKAEIKEKFPFEDVEQMMKKPLHNFVREYNEYDTHYESGSTDVGDVGYATPTVNLKVATACLGNVGHSWQYTSFSGSDIGMKGMLRAAEVLAYCCVLTAERPESIEKARAELIEKNGGKYSCPLPDYTQPPIGKY